MDDTNRKKILVADDEPSVRLLLKRILSKNYTVLEASDGEEAVDMAHSQKPDIILMDLMMPKLDGVGACNIIKSDLDTKAIPVVMVTARGHELDQQYAKDMGADGHITKPFASRELLHTIGQFLESPK